MYTSGQYTPISYSKTGNIKLKRSAHPRIDFVCDKCGQSFTENLSVHEQRFKWTRVCECAKCSRAKLCSAVSLSGKRYDADGKYIPNGGNFTTERVKKMSEEEYAKYCEQRRRASNIHHARLQADPVAYKEHYDKVFKKSTIGYVSDGQRQLRDALAASHPDVELEKNIGGLRADIFIPSYNLVVEFYGDFWHMNPKKYPADYLNKATGKTAKEKWDSDRRRNMFLRNQGYTVVVIWETEWKTDPNTVLERIQAKTNATYRQIAIPLRKYFWMNDGVNKKKLVAVDKVKEFTDNGWKLGRKVNNEVS